MSNVALNQKKIFIEIFGNLARLRQEDEIQEYWALRSVYSSKFCEFLEECEIKIIVIDNPKDEEFLKQLISIPDYDISVYSIGPVVLPFEGSYPYKKRKDALFANIQAFKRGFTEHNRGYITFSLRFLVGDTWLPAAELDYNSLEELD